MLGNIQTHHEIRTHTSDVWNNIGRKPVGGSTESAVHHCSFTYNSKQARSPHSVLTHRPHSVVLT